MFHIEASHVLFCDDLCNWSYVVISQLVYRKNQMTDFHKNEPLVVKGGSIMATPEWILMTLFGLPNNQFSMFTLFLVFLRSTMNSKTVNEKDSLCLGIIKWIQTKLN